MKRTWRRAVPVLLACLALAAGGTAVAGTAIVLSGPDRGSPLETGSRATASPAPTVTIVASSEVAPLRRVVPPDVLGVGTGPVDPARLAEIRGLKDVRDVIAVDGGAVRLQGRKVNVFGVDPSAFRSWTPPATAADRRLWTGLAENEFVVSDQSLKALGLQVGMPYTIVARGTPFVRLGAAAPLGLPGVDMLVNTEISRRLGLVHDIAVLVNAPGADSKKLARRIRAILGHGSQALDLHDRATMLPVEGNVPKGRARSYLQLYQQAAATCPGLSWTVLAAIGQIESGHGRNVGPSSAGALGPMQFMPSTWRIYGVDGDGDGRADIMDPYDAVPAAARYLCANGAGRGGTSLSTAIWHYNHADWYVREVLGLAAAYAHAYASSR